MLTVVEVLVCSWLVPSQKHDGRKRSRGKLSLYGSQEAKREGKSQKGGGQAPDTVVTSVHEVNSFHDSGRK